MKNPLVSVIMNCHNSQKFLSEAIESVINQTYQNWELIFWDNKSTDESPKIVKSYKDARIKYFSAISHTSLGQARNLAIEKSKGELIAFLDCDDLWMPRKLELQIPNFKDKNVGIVVCNSIFFNNNKKEKILYKKKPKEGYVFRDLLQAYNISLETAMIRKLYLDSLNHWFDDRFEVIEEFDLFIRLSRFCKLAYVDEILAKWRVHSASLTWKRKDLFPKETRLFIKKIKKNIPEISIKYKDSLEILLNNIIYQEFLINWGADNQKLDRKDLGSIKFKSRKFLIIYLLSYILPFKIFNYLNNKRQLL